MVLLGIVDHVTAIIQKIVGVNTLTGGRFLDQDGVKYADPIPAPPVLPGYAEGMIRKGNLIAAVGVMPVIAKWILTAAGHLPAVQSAIVR